MIYFRYVPHSRVSAFATVGWIDRGFAPGHHGCHSRVMKWEGEGDPPDPEAMRAIAEACRAEEGVL